MSNWHLMSDPPNHNQHCVLANVRESIIRYGCGFPYELAWYCAECKEPKWIGRNGADLLDYTHWTDIPVFDGVAVQYVDYEKEHKQFLSWYDNAIKPISGEIKKIKK
jgi:hypothetical protein